MQAPITLIPQAVVKAVGGDMLRGRQYNRAELAEAADGGDATVVRQRSIHDGYREKFEAVMQALGTIDPTRTPEAGLLDIRGKADKALESLAARATEATKATKEAIISIDAEITKRLAIVDNAHGAEIRSHVRSLKKGERGTFVLAAIEAGDTTTMGALLSAPAYLSGLTDAEQTNLGETYRSRHCGDLMKRKALYELTLKINDTAFNELLASFGSLFAPERVSSIQQRAAAAARARESIHTV